MGEIDTWWEVAILALEMAVLVPLYWWLAGWLVVRFDVVSIDWSGSWTTPPPIEVAIVADTSDYLRRMDRVRRKPGCCRYPPAPGVHRWVN
jgi:hypothetical protein